MKSNRLIKFLEKYTAKKCNPDVSFELPDNHFYNKKVQHERKISLELKSKGNRRRRISTKKLNRKDSSLKVSIVDIKQQESNNMRNRRNRLEALPSTLKIMPLIPFWRTSFDIIEHQYEVVPPVGARTEENTARLSEADYMTMKRKSSDRTEPIYI